MKKFLIFTLVFAALAGIAGCASGGNAGTSASTVTPTPSPTPVDITMSGPKESVGTVVYALAEMYMETSGKYIDWKRTTDGRAVAYCAIDNSDIAVISRDIKEQELSTYEDVNTTPLCTEAVAIVAGSGCPLDNITIEQLAQIFSGDVTDWVDLGGSGAITVYALSDSTSVGNAFEEMALGLDETGTQLKLDETVCDIVETAADMPGLITGNSLSIGFMPLSLIGDSGVKMLKVEGVAASETTAKSGSYPLSRPYSIVTVGEVSADAQAFIDYCTADKEALAYLQQQGYILP